MGLCFLSLPEFCAVAGHEVEQYNVLRRRGQVPMVPPPDLSEEALKQRGFEAGGALYLTVANELVEHYEMSRTSAATIAAKSIVCHGRWEEIASTSARLAERKDPPFHILFAVINWPTVAHLPPKRGQPLCAVGTFKEIAEQYPNAHDVIAVSMTRCAALMRQRAAKARIDLTAFWEN